MQKEQLRPYLEPSQFRISQPNEFHPSVPESPVDSKSIRGVPPTVEGVTVAFMPRLTTESLEELCAKDAIMKYVRVERNIYYGDINGFHSTIHKEMQRDGIKRKVNDAGYFSAYEETIIFEGTSGSFPQTNIKERIKTGEVTQEDIADPNTLVEAKM